MKLKFRIELWHIVLVGFIALCAFFWLDEYFDITHIIMRAPRTPFNWREALLETGIVLVVGVFTLRAVINNSAIRNRFEKEINASRKALSEKNKELSELNDLKNKFLGIAAHDLRNPISTIKIASSLLLKKTGRINEEGQKHLLSIINNTSEYIYGMVDSLLDVSIIESGKLEIKKNVNDYMEFIRKSVNINRMLAEKAKKKIIVTGSADTLDVCFDWYRIRQVMDNLLGNAIKYSFPDSVIKVEVSREKNFVMTKVIDSGPGISKDDLSRIFSEFYVSDARPADGKKTGLGLAIVKKIIEKHDGDIGVTSSKDKGTVFSFRLPI